ncbi:hypothetical protein Taro_032692, partial [Colocasia esculenta]|nr:hypothetical protein [Colocasia esculenta]
IPSGKPGLAGKSLLLLLLLLGALAVAYLEVGTPPMPIEPLTVVPSVAQVAAQLAGIDLLKAAVLELVLQVLVVSTQCFKYKAKMSSSVDTSSGGVDTRDSSQNTFWPTWDSVSTLAQIVSTQCFKYKAKMSSSVDTSSGGVDTRDSSQNTFWPIWDSVSTLAQVVSTLEAFPEHLLGCFGT